MAVICLIGLCFAAIYMNKLHNRIEALEKRLALLDGGSSHTSGAAADPPSA